MRGDLNADKTAAQVIVDLLHVSEIAEEDRWFELRPEDAAKLNPETGTCPVFRYKHDAELARLICARFPVLRAAKSDSATNPWGVKFLRMFDMTNDSHLFMTAEEQSHSDGSSDAALVPLYEAKMFWQFEHRAAEYDPSVERFTEYTRRTPDDEPRPRYWVEQRHIGYRRPFLIGYRDITNAESERTTVAACLPGVAAGNTVQICLLDECPADLSACFLAQMNSLANDFFVRQRIAGNHLTHSILRQVRMPRPALYAAPLGWATASASAWIVSRVLELSYTSWALEPFARECGYDGPPLRWDEERRFLLRCELDAAYFHLYLGKEDEWCAQGTSELLDSFPAPLAGVEYIMETFPIVKRKDIEKHGTYRTRDTILGIYEEMAEAIRTGQPYQTRLAPAPGPPTNDEGMFVSVSQWTSWPSHIHMLRAQQLHYGDVVADILVLLREWNSAVSILALEPAVLLMQSDQARRTFAGHVLTTTVSKGDQSKYRIIEGMDLVYQGLVSNGAIEPVGQNGYRLLKPELIAGLSAEYRRRARQVVQAIGRLDRPEDALAIVAEVTHERYAVTVP